MKCPRCMKPIGPDDKVCPSCSAILVVERKPTRPDEEKGWTLRHLASIMGRAGCAVLIAQNVLLLIGVAAFAREGVAFLQGTNPNPDLAPVTGLIYVGGTLDLVGLGLVAAALVVLGAGAMLLRRKDPFTEEEVLIPPQTAALPIVAGLLVYVWILFTAIWRVAWPASAGRNAAQLLADFAANGSMPIAPNAVPAMMGFWILGAICLLVAAILLRLFVRRLPAKIVSPRPMKPSSWLDYTVFNLVIVFVIAIFPLGWAAYTPLKIVFLSALAIKLTVLALVGAFAYWSLLGRFDAFGKLSLLVPIMKAIRQEVSTVQTVIRAEAAKTVPREPTVVLPPPTEDDMAGIERVK